MKRLVLTLGAILVSCIFLTSNSTWARNKKGGHSYEHCLKGCNIAKANLLKACEQANTAEAKQKCRTLGSKKLEEECNAQCKKREQGKKK